MAKIRGLEKDMLSEAREVKALQGTWLSRSKVLW